MKKYVSVLLVFALLFGFASCTLFKNYDYVNEAITKTAALDSAELTVTTNVQVTANDTPETLSSEYHVKMKGLQTIAPTFSADMDVTLYGETVPASVYYEAPYYYVKTELDSVRLEKGDLLEKTDFASEWKKMNAIIPEEILKTAVETEKDDGTKSVTLTFDADAFTAAYDTLLRTWHEKLVADHVGEYSESSLTVSNAKAEIGVHETSGYLTYYSVSCTLDIASKNTLGEDKPISAVLTYSTTYRDAGADITPDTPEGHTDFEITDGLKLDPYKLMTEAVENARNLNDYKADVNLDIKFKTMGMQMDMPTSIALRVKDAQTENRTFSYTMTMSMLGIEISQDVYFADGFYYMNDGLNKIKYPYSEENEKTYGYKTDIDMLLKTLPENFFENVEVQRNADGTKTIALNIPSVFRYYTDLTADVKDGAGYNLIWSDGDLTVVINKDGSLKSYELVLKPYANIEGVTTDFNITYGITYRNDDDIAPIVPEDLSAYLTLAELNGVVFDIVNQAVTDVLNANEMSVTCNLESITSVSNISEVSIAQNYTLAANQLQTFSPVYRYIVESQVNDIHLIEDVYYEDGYYYISSDAMKEPLKMAAVNLESYNVLASISKILQTIPDTALEKAETQGAKGAVCTLYWELDETDFRNKFPNFWELNVTGYRVTKQNLDGAYIEVTTDANGKLLSYSIFYEVSAELSPDFGLYLKSEKLTASGSVSYTFGTSDAAIIVTPPENYQNYTEPTPPTGAG